MDNSIGLCYGLARVDSSIYPLACTMWISETQASGLEAYMPMHSSNPQNHVTTPKT